MLTTRPFFFLNFEFEWYIIELSSFELYVIELIYHFSSLSSTHHPFLFLAETSTHHPKCRKLTNNIYLNLDF